jgi:hypothetical protein
MIKLLFQYISVVGLALFTLSCQSSSDDDQKRLDELGRVLVGRWIIDEYQMSAYSRGVNLDGNIIFKDTIFRNLGVLEIPPGDLSAIVGVYESYSYDDLVFTYGNNTQDVSIVRVLLNKQGILASFRLGLREIGGFMETSRMFSRNVIIEVESDNKIRLIDSNDPSKDLLVLVRE